MFNNDFNGHAEFTTILKGKLLLKFTMSDKKFQGTKHPYHHLRNFISAMSLKEIDKDILHLILPWTFDKEVMRRCNVTDPQKVVDWDDLCRKFSQSHR